MNEQEQRIAIAEFYGFRIVPNQNGHDYAIVKPYGSTCVEFNLEGQTLDERLSLELACFPD
jgi:hypothetical protein